MRPVEQKRKLFSDVVFRRSRRQGILITKISYDLPFLDQSRIIIILTEEKIKTRAKQPGEKAARAL